jgi:hypothetical protein
MLGFNIHSSALPELKPMASHTLWNVWDIAIDFCTTLESGAAEPMLYDICMKTFETFPSPGVYPIYTHFMLMPAFAVDTSARLLALIDNNPAAADMAARSNLPNVIANMEKPTETGLLMLAKMQVSEHGIDLDVQLPVTFSLSKKREVLKCGMLNICLAVSKTWLPSFNKMTQICIEQAETCAPLAGLLLGILIDKGGRMLVLHGYISPYQKLCTHPGEDVRATSVFLLGSSVDAEVVPTLEQMINDSSPVVREQVIYAFFNLAKNQVDRRGLTPVESLANDPDEVVKKAYETAKQVLSQMKSGAVRDPPNPNPILKNLMKSVKANGFEIRYRSNVFEIPDE